MQAGTRLQYLARVKVAIIADCPDVIAGWEHGSHGGDAGVDIGCSPGWGRGILITAAGCLWVGDDLAQEAQGEGRLAERELELEGSALHIA